MKKTSLTLSIILLLFAGGVWSEGFILGGSEKFEPSVGLDCYDSSTDKKYFFLLDFKPNHFMNIKKVRKHGDLLRLDISSEAEWKGPVRIQYDDNFISLRVLPHGTLQLNRKTLKNKPKKNKDRKWYQIFPERSVLDCESGSVERIKKKANSSLLKYKEQLKNDNKI